MHKNKYQKRRGLRPSTSAASATQQELFQGPIQQPSGSQISNDLGRETARQLRENANPNTRFIDKPTPTTNKNLLNEVSTRQQSMISDAQQQAFSKGNTAQSKPKAPPSNLVFKGGGVRYQPVMRANLLTAVAGIAADALVEPLADVISDNVIHPLISAVTGRDFLTVDELRRREAMRIKDNAEVAANDAYNEAQRQRRLQAAQVPIGVGEAPDAPVLPMPSSEAIVEVAEQMPRHMPRAHSQASRADTRNREYKIRRAALGDNPTQEEVDAVVAYGLEQHRINFPGLYQ